VVDQPRQSPKRPALPGRRVHATDRLQRSVSSTRANLRVIMLGRPRGIYAPVEARNIRPPAREPLPISSDNSARVEPPDGAWNSRSARSLSAVRTVSQSGRGTATKCRMRARGVGAKRPSQADSPAQRTAPRRCVAGRTHRCLHPGPPHFYLFPPPNSTFNSSRHLPATPQSLPNGGTHATNLVAAKRGHGRPRIALLVVIDCYWKWLSKCTVG
jgi:hypothetical protein